MPAQHHAVTNSAPSERTNISGTLESPINLTDGQMNSMPPPPLPVPTARTAPPTAYKPIDNDASRQHQGMLYGQGDPSSFTASHPQAQTKTSRVDQCQPHHPPLY
jgi:hypothetical protein